MNQAIYIASDDNHSAVLRHASTLIKILTDLNGEDTFSSDTAAFSDFIISEMSQYNARLIEEGIAADIIHKATYLISSAFDDVFTRKKLYGDNTQRGFLLNTHNEPGALSRFWEISDDFRDGVDHSTVDIAILAMTLIELGYQGKYENHPDRYAIIRVQSEALKMVIDEFMAHQQQMGVHDYERIPRSPLPFWPVLSLTLLLSIGAYFVTEKLISYKFRYIDSTVHSLEQGKK